MVTAAPRPPSRARLILYHRFLNPLTRFLIRRLRPGGGEIKSLAILRVQGRKTGRVHEVPVGVTALDGHRYVMTMLGDAQWARNLRAAGRGQLVTGKRTQEVAAQELEGKEKTALLTRCCQYREFARPARSALKSAFGVTVKRLSKAEIDLLGQVWFVFRLLDAAPDQNSPTAAGG